MLDFKNIDKELLDKDFIKGVSDVCDYEYEELKSYIVTSIEESKHTLKLIDKYDLKKKSILEFGSGLGIASIVLSLNGYDITSFEPGGLGFEKNILVNEYIKDYFKLKFNLISNLSDINSNSFYFIFSNNVLEHIPDIENTILKLNDILTEDGIMVHNVPNYTFPYEPHFGIFFFPLFPKKMSFLISKKITETNLWKSINFINTFDVISYSKKTNANVTFEKELMYKTIQRIENDIEFANRHKRISKIISILKKIGILKLIQLLPISLNTPMIFEWKKNV